MIVAVIPLCLDVAQMESHPCGMLKRAGADASTQLLVAARTNTQWLKDLNTKDVLVGPLTTAVAQMGRQRPRGQMEKGVRVVIRLSLAAATTTLLLHLVQILVAVIVPPLALAAALMGQAKPLVHSLKVALRSQGRLARSRRMLELGNSSVFSGSLILRREGAPDSGMVEMREQETDSQTRSLVKMFASAPLALQDVTYQR